MDWPRSERDLVAEQRRLASAAPAAWRPPGARFDVAACFACSSRDKEGDGASGDPVWAGAALTAPGARPVTRALRGEAGAAYRAGLLALREGPLLEDVVRALPEAPAVLIVNATGRDHPRRAGVALHLGALLGLPTVGVTHRPLLAAGAWPPPVRGERSPLELEGEIVGVWLTTRSGARPLAVHAAWRTGVAVAAEVVLAASTGRARTPTPLRLARRAARRARTAGERSASRPRAGAV